MVEMEGINDEECMSDSKSEKEAWQDFVRCSSCKSSNVYAIWSPVAGYLWRCRSCGQKEAECGSCRYWNEGKEICVNAESHYHKQRASKRFICSDWDPIPGGTLTPTVEWTQEGLDFRDSIEKDHKK